MKKMKSHPNQKHDSMKEFNMGHWEKSKDCLEAGGSRYGAEIHTGEEMQKNADKLANYVRKHKPSY